MKWRVAALAVAALGAVGIAGCMDSARVNATCQWSDSLDRPLDLTQRFDREHLRVDAEIANELMVRFGDVHYRNRPDMARPLRDQCMTVTVDTIIARHHVTRAQITKAEFKRVWWADVLAVFLPFAIIGALLTDAVVKRVSAHFESSDRVLATVSAAALTVAVALTTLAMANFWSFAVEGMRLRNGHVSNRNSFIPIVAHGQAAFLISLAICAIVAFVRFRSTPLTGGENRPFAIRRAATRV